MRIAAVLAGALMAAAAVSAAQGAVRIKADPGGQIGPYLQNLVALRNSGERVIIDGPCLSACTMVLGVIPRERICVTSRARLGFHAAWHPGQNGRPVPSQRRHAAVDGNLSRQCADLDQPARRPVAAHDLS